MVLMYEGEGPNNRAVEFIADEALRRNFYTVLVSEPFLPYVAQGGT